MIRKPRFQKISIRRDAVCYWLKKAEIDINPLVTEGTNLFALVVLKGED
ncbi:hypothetical protein Dalk_4204 [Desulfatibacillum aliphaticivorans]|uniref:Uncharacterized protein n=1 Tax=Desulfatibacillum aliphaticivorans TaxID=218208 RepID=B8FN16_DESAL|nr:hypothetical protein [Desulfatibacillum aliphaticivorans]ACL05886.1 hypothetical protein Dalk_4204 [Desulfatibacillum aliphaticivorans]